MDYAKAYSELHENTKRFPGSVVRRYVPDIERLVALTSPRQILDYGSGKGYQYLKDRIHERWGGILPYCYDVGVRQLATKPTIKFDGIICTDMLEHIEEQDLPGILDDALGLLTDEDRPTFAFFSASCRPSDKLLPDGRNVHVTINPPGWWRATLNSARLRRGLPKLIFSAAYERSLEDGGGILRDEDLSRLH